MDYGKVPVTDYYGVNCFSDGVMRERLPREIYGEMVKIRNGEMELSRSTADVVARVMKEWALERGATHYSHWFQPLTGLTAEKHDSFISPCADGSVIMKFSGKELIVGEPDASSFPNGGLRTTFEARGYTAWDTTSPAFLKQNKSGLTLTIPTAFVSYTGEALDKKTPLLRSMEAINDAAMRLLRALGNVSAKRVISSVGPEQEYFLVDRVLHDRRPDLKLCGRTVFGSMGAKGQEKEDHYFGAIKERVALFMQELNQELWKLGIAAKTQHNEVAPNQFELANVFSSANVASDGNQIVMELMRNIAEHHGLVCLLHEKPFAGVNGSGKHSNWSIATDDGLRLMDPGDTPADNAQFLLFLVAVIKAVDVYAPLLRASTGVSGNDHRLGGNEAPPAIISIFLGDQLVSILEGLASGNPVRNQEGEVLEIGVTVLPKFPKDMTDRNRTSPMAFTGNKFEFRMVGSSQSLAGPNVVMNTAVAEVLDEFAVILKGCKDVNKSINQIVIDTYRAHKRIIFNGNGYSGDWENEAAARGLKNIRCTIDAIVEFESPESIELFTKYRVLSGEELRSRVEIYLENYITDINIEAGVMINLSNRYILPAVVDYLSRLADSVVAVKSLGVDVNVTAQSELVLEVSENLNCLRGATLKLTADLGVAQDVVETKERAKVYYQLCQQMCLVRSYGDTLESLCDKNYWPLPSYEDLLFTL